MERKLEVNKIKEVWKGMKQITGHRRNSTTEDGDVARANPKIEAKTQQGLTHSLCENDNIHSGFR